MQETTPLNLQDAIDTIEVAVALGHPIPMLEGTTLWEITVYLPSIDSSYGDKDPIPLGVHGSKAAAKRELRNWIVKSWKSGTTPGVSDQELIGFTVNEKSDDEIIAKYFYPGREAEYFMDEITITGKPADKTVFWDQSAW